jgi:hypothetical protein
MKKTIKNLETKSIKTATVKGGGGGWGTTAVVGIIGGMAVGNP